MAKFRVYEIEHNGDVDASVEDLRKAGCTNVRVLTTDFEESESMVVECTMPAGVTTRAGLQALLEQACL